MAVEVMGAYIDRVGFELYSGKNVELSTTIFQKWHLDTADLG